MRCAFACLLLGIVATQALPPQVVSAGGMPPALAVGYGNGVHAYHAGDYQCSYDELTGVIEAGSNDPRAFYFRGLAALKLGRTDEAEADFRQGANLEADGVGGRAVSRALERVQGGDRLKLEHFRAEARVSAVQRNREAIRQRYSDIQEAEPEVLRRRRPEGLAPVEPLKAPAPKQRPAPADGEAEAEEPMAEEAAAEPGAEPAEEKPAAEPGEEPAAEEPAAEEPAAEEPADTSDPFGNDAPGDKPAMEAAADEPAADEKPAAEPTADTF
ncbi:MAG: hypothetical protein WCJ18_08635 [Planctomycetota bacterium]